ncbi:MAG: hypothetical protein K6G69_09665 [Lachnospiraceae bacterium]|nr:hypothetical protein [Lachnospiraceae bacterium]
MIKELTTAYKLVRYGLRIKQQTFFAILFAVLGIVFEILIGEETPLGAIYIILSGMFLYQMILTSDLSTLVQSSPYKKKIQCLYPVVSLIPWLSVSMVIITIIHWNFAKKSEEAYAQQANLMITLGLIMFITLVYFGICYKFFIISTLVMAFSIMLPMGAFARGGVFADNGLSFSQGTIIACIMVVIGSVLCIILTNAFYRRDISKMALRNLMRNMK